MSASDFMKMAQKGEFPSESDSDEEDLKREEEK